MKKDTVVLGLGNPLMKDEGIGIFLINRFLSKSQDYPDVEFIDAGTGGLAILHLITDRKKAIFIDCAFMEDLPGTIGKFTPDQVQSIKKMAHLSLHESDILKIIQISQKMNQCPEEIIIFGIEPEIVALGQGLSPQLECRIDDYISEISKELIS